MAFVTGLIATVRGRNDLYSACVNAEEAQDDQRTVPATKGNKRCQIFDRSGSDGLCCV